MSTIIRFPRQTIGGYEIVVQPGCIDGSPVAYIFRAGTRRVVWEGLLCETVEEAFEGAKKWVADHPQVVQA